MSAGNFRIHRARLKIPSVQMWGRYAQVRVLNRHAPSGEVYHLPTTWQMEVIHAGLAPFLHQSNKKILDRLQNFLKCCIILTAAMDEVPPHAVWFIFIPGSMLTTGWLSIWIRLVYQPVHNYIAHFNTVTHTCTSSLKVKIDLVWNTDQAACICDHIGNICHWRFAPSTKCSKSSR